MDRKVGIIRETITAIEALERDVCGDRIGSSDVLASKIAKLADSLAMMHEEGRSLDEASMLTIPRALFDHLDNLSVSNPELYQLKMMEEAESRANQLKQKLTNLDELRNSIERTEEDNNS